ncbi:MAG: DUF4037 domain-containing protein [Oscillospiraceae bacterium]|nr:DUF4037 domain-containing protein [Oscillospiraceae bacterium]
MNGLSLSREYLQRALPSLREQFPREYARMAAGLAGNGSECFGYDDEISRDHDWGVDFFLWVSEQDRDSAGAIGDWKLRFLETHPPSFPRTRSEYGARVGVMTAGDFYRSLIGVPGCPRTLDEWRRVPEENLAMAVNGEVFFDNAGEFTAPREALLKFYPDDLRLKRLSYRCMALAQTGQYNFDRVAKRRDWVTVRTVLSRFTDSAIAAVFLLNRRYRPYYKWAFRAMTELPILGGKAGEILTRAALTPGFDAPRLETLRADLEALCALVAAELRRQGLSRSDDEFLTAQGEELRAQISDELLRSLPAQYEI